MKPDVWMPLVIGKYLADTRHLARDQHGAYLLLLMSGWTRGGSLPDDDSQLARMALATTTEWKRLRPVMAPFFTIAGGEWRQKRLDVELAAAVVRTAKATAKAEAAAAARWEKERQKNASSNAPSIAQASKRECLEETSLSVPLPKTLKAPRARRTRCPPGFAISDRVKDWAQDKGHANLNVHFEKFMSYVKTKDPTYADWDEALMTCVRENWAKVTAPVVRPMTVLPNLPRRDGDIPEAAKLVIAKMTRRQA